MKSNKILWKIERFLFNTHFRNGRFLSYSHFICYNLLTINMERAVSISSVNVHCFVYACEAHRSLRGSYVS